MGSATDSTAAVGASPNNPAAASTLQLIAANATSITLTGNHGVDFSGSNVSNVTTLDASGVVANTGNPNGNLTDATVIENDGLAGAVTFTTAVTDEDVTITTGNGNDRIDATSVGSAVNSTNAATISTGAGRDTITGGDDADTINAGSENDIVNSSAGADSITLGAGNDAYVLRFATDSVLATYDTITDFSANTYGAGASGAVNNAGANGVAAANLTGDLIDLQAVMLASVTSIDVLVASNAADAQTFLQNTATASVGNTQTGIALDSSSNQLYIDLDSNGTVDSVIKLAGVTTIDEAAFIF